MQQMNPEQASNEWQDSYGTYKGETDYARQSGEKLNAKDEDAYDEQFATLLAQKMKQELGGDLQSANTPSSGQRMLLAILSLAFMVILFIAVAIILAVVLTSGAPSVDSNVITAVGWVSAIMCIATVYAVIYVNYFFYKKR